MAKNPVLPIYYNDLSASTIDWSDEEFGAYVRLLIYQWDKGFIPGDLKRLIRIAESAEKNWTVLCKKFTPDEQGFLKNSVMEKIRIKRDSFLKHQVENGIQGGRPKTQKKPNRKPKSKPKRKPLEKEIEIEEEIEIEMPFTSEKFRVLWQNWKKYRLQEFKQAYKSGQSEQAALAHLTKISGGNEQTAEQIINQSFTNQWKGLFELKKPLNGNTSKQARQDRAFAHHVEIGEAELAEWREENGRT